MTYEEAIQYPIDRLTQAFNRLRQAIKDRDAEYAETMRPHKAQLGVYEAALLHLLQKAGVNSAPNDYGTPYISEIETIKMENWDDFHAFVEELQDPDFLVKSANPTKVKEWRNQHKSLPPGLSSSTMLKLNVRN